MRKPFILDPKAAVDANRYPYYGHGKIEILPKVPVYDLDDVATLYTPGVAHSVQEIIDDPSMAYELSIKGNSVAVISDGTAVLGWGNTGPLAALPVMEGKAAMFKLLVGIDAIPLCLRTSNEEELIRVIKALEPNFGGINLEDVAAPACFSIMERLEDELSIPCIHDDQYGTATVAIAALINAWRVLGRTPETQKIVVNGAGAAGSAIFNLLQGVGVRDIIVHERAGILCKGGDYNAHHRRIAEMSNQEQRRGGLAEAVRGADTFIGVSVANQLTSEMVKIMAPDPIILALANPQPEIMPEQAYEGGASIVCTGRFDYVNQCNNVLAFPGLMRGALETRAKKLTRDIYIAAAYAVADDVPEAQRRVDNILPTPFSETLYQDVAEATAQAIIKQGLARYTPALGDVWALTDRLRGLVSGRQAVLKSLGAKKVAR